MKAAEILQKAQQRRAVKVADILRKARKPKPISVANLLHKHMISDGPKVIQAEYAIKSIVGDKRLVTGQVYAPDTLDAHGHFMTREELEKVAHDFLANGLLTSIDVQHNNVTIPATIVESYIAKKGDPQFEEGAWVATTKIDDPAVWQGVKDGRINGYSFEILTFREDMEVEFEYSTWYYGFTDPDPHDKHDHPFMVRLDENGEIIWGKTGLGSDGSPPHTITRSNVTNAVAGRTHRIHLRGQ